MIPLINKIEKQAELEHASEIAEKIFRFSENEIEFVALGHVSHADPIIDVIKR